MSYRFKVFLNMMVSLVILAINITILFLWFQLLRGAILPQLHGTAWIIGKILFGWWLTGVIASFLYNEEVFPWKFNPLVLQSFPPFFIVAIAADKAMTGEDWYFCYDREVLLGGPAYFLHFAVFFCQMHATQSMHQE